MSWFSLAGHSWDLPGPYKTPLPSNAFTLLCRDGAKGAVGMGLVWEVRAPEVDGTLFHRAVLFCPPFLGGEGWNSGTILCNVR